MTGKDKFDQTGEEIKKQTEQKKEIEKQQEANVTEQLQKKNIEQLAKDNEEMRRQMSESASVGADNLTGSLPLLKIYTVNKSAEEKLADGLSPQDGSFLHKASGRAWEDVYFHPCTISRGFYAWGMPDPKTGVKPIVFNNILAGLILNDSDYTPFIMYFTGTKLQNLWNFRDELRKFVKRKVNPIPMFCITAHMTAEKFKTQNYGLVWIAKFDYERDENGQEPLIDLNFSRFLEVKKMTVRMVDEVARVILDKEIDQDGNQVAKRVNAVDAEDVATEEQHVLPSKENATEHVSPDDIPF